MNCHILNFRKIFQSNVFYLTKYYSTLTNTKTVLKIYESSESKEHIEIKVGIQHNLVQSNNFLSCRGGLNH